MNIKRTLVMTAAATALTAGAVVPSANASLNLFAPVTTSTALGNITTYCPVTNLLLNVLGGATSSTSTPVKTTTPATTTKGSTATTTKGSTATTTKGSTSTTKTGTAVGNV